MASKKKPTAKPAKKPAKGKTARRSSLQIELDREVIADLLLEGQSLRQIAKAVKLSHEMIRKERDVIYKAWEDEAREGRALLLTKELKRLEKLAAIAWDCLRASIGQKIDKTKKVIDKHMSVSQGHGMGSELEQVQDVHEETKRIKLLGDPRWAQVILETIRERNRLLGTYNYKGPEPGDHIERVKLDQEVYIPGLPALTIEQLGELFAKAGVAADGPDGWWHLLFSLLPNQDAHTFEGVVDGSANRD